MGGGSNKCDDEEYVEVEVLLLHGCVHDVDGPDMQKISYQGLYGIFQIPIYVFFFNHHYAGINSLHSGFILKLFYSENLFI